MKRKKLIQSKLNDKTKVDFEEIHEDDARSINRMIADAEDQVHAAKKSIKRYQEDHTMCLGDEFVALVDSKIKFEARVESLKQIKEEYV